MAVGLLLIAQPGFAPDPLDAGDAPAPDPADAALTVAARSLTQARTTADRWDALAPLLLGPAPRAVEADATSFPAQHAGLRSLPEVMATLLARLGAPGMDEDQREALAAHEATLPPALRVALRQLLDAVDAALAQATEAAGASGPAAAWALVATLERVAPALAEAALALPAAPRAAPPFPGPNEGILLNDPYNLVLVGDVGPSVYRGNTWPFEGIAPTRHLLLLDLGGDDAYHSEAATTDAPTLRLSVALDLAGRDTYAPAHPGTTASAGTGGVAVLLDLAGDDAYHVQDRAGLAHAVSGGGGVPATALLLDHAGNDRYHAGASSLGAARGEGAAAVLLDLRGHDTYEAGSESQGVAMTGGRAALVDLQGDDVLDAGPWSQGHARGPGGVGLHLNVGGRDLFRSGSDSRGSTLGDTATAAFLDLCGFDDYAQGLGANNQGWQQGPLGRGLDTSDPVLCGRLE